MAVERIFHMKEGIGKSSYARNSSKQRKALEMARHITEETISNLYVSTKPESMGVADLGCSSGPNTFSVLGEVVAAVEEKCRRAQKSPPEFRLFLNDLPTNDFNSIFAALPEFYGSLRRRGEKSPSVFMAAVPGSFYGRLFPSNSLHFVHSSFSLHWLSQVPAGLFDERGKSVNKGKIYISESSPQVVADAYSLQFRKDFCLFLESRSEEVIRGGRMVLVLLGRPSKEHSDRGNTIYWELLAQAFAQMVSLGEIAEEKVESYKTHFYAPSVEELEGIVGEEGSFAVDRVEMFEMGTDDGNGVMDNGTSIAAAVRAVQETLILHHFGDGVLLLLDRLFEIYADLVDEEIAKQEIKATALIVVLRKLS